MKLGWIALVVFLITVLLAGCLQNLTNEPKVIRITKDELRSMMNREDVIIVDVRGQENWKKSEWKIKGALLEDPEGDVKAWARKYPKDKTLIFYCA